MIGEQATNPFGGLGRGLHQDSLACDQVCDSRLARITGNDVKMKVTDGGAGDEPHVVANVVAGRAMSLIDNRKHSTDHTGQLGFLFGRILPDVLDVTLWEDQQVARVVGIQVDRHREEPVGEDRKVHDLGRPLVNEAEYASGRLLALKVRELVEIEEILHRDVLLLAQL